MPVRGQYLIFPEQGSGDRPDYIGDDENPLGMAYAIPQGTHVLVGGTEEYGEECPEFVLDPEALVSRAAEFAPWLRELDVSSAKRVAGLRPYRAQGIRLELDQTGEVPVIHNYGHGGSGFSLSWSCAESVQQLVVRVVEDETA